MLWKAVLEIVKLIVKGIQYAFDLTTEFRFKDM